MSPKHHHSARSPRCPRLEQRSHYRSEDETVSARQLCPRGDSSQGHESRVPCCGYLTHAPRPEAARLVGRGQAAAERYTGLCVIAAGAECSRTRKRLARQFRAPAQRPEAVVVMYQVARRESQRLSGDRAAGRRSRSANCRPGPMACRRQVRTLGQVRCGTLNLDEHDSGSGHRAQATPLGAPSCQPRSRAERYRRETQQPASERSDTSTLPLRPHQTQMCASGDRIYLIQAP